MFTSLIARVFVVLTLAVWAGLPASAFAQAVGPPKPTLTLPANGDQLDTHNVHFEWSAVSGVGSVTYTITITDMDHGIVLYEVSGITQTSYDCLMYDAYYEWHVTATDDLGDGEVSDSSYCFVLSVDTAIPDLTLTSPNGDDTGPPDCAVTSPNGGEELTGGSEATITWYGVDDMTSAVNLKIGIYFSADGGSSWSTIGSVDHSSGAYSWRVPNISTDRGLIRMTATDLQEHQAVDVSDAVFTIVADPSKPQDRYSPDSGASESGPWTSAPMGDALKGGSYFTITWYVLDDLTSTPDLKIALFFSPDGGKHWEDIVYLDDNPGAFRWYVPNINTDYGLIKVTATDEEGNVGLDAGDFVFSIVSGSSYGSSFQRLTVGGPNGGQALKRGSARTITWSSTLAGGDVAIELFKGKKRVRTIAKRTPNDGAFKWKVPGNLLKGKNYSVRITCLDYTPKLTDVSDRFFAIR